MNTMRHLNKISSISLCVLLFAFFVEANNFGDTFRVLFFVLKSAHNGVLILEGHHSVPNSLMVRWYEPGRDNHEFDPSLGNLFLVRCVNMLP